MRAAQTDKKDAKLNAPAVSAKRVPWYYALKIEPVSRVDLLHFNNKYNRLDISFILISGPLAMHN